MIVKETDEKQEFEIEKNQKQVNFPLKLVLCNTDAISETQNTSIFVDENKLKFPLVLRRWQEGDSFCPFGMAGQSKKVSKLFKDEKLSLIDKENTWILCSDNQIVWVVGIRQDERFKIDSSTINRLQIALL